MDENAPPASWRWHSGVTSGGDAVVVDIDGVLSDATGRQHYLDGDNRDWKGFFDACGDDLPIEEMGELLSLLDPELTVVLLTGRPLRVEPETIAWLDRNGVRWDVLIMREMGDYSAARQFKEATIQLLRNHGFNLRLAFEDDKRNQEIFRAQGVPCVYIHSGYYD